MPTQTAQAIKWALIQTYTFADETHPVTKDNAPSLVDKVREYFNANKITYGTFSYDDLRQYL